MAQEMKTLPVLIDTLDNLNSFGTALPDGLIAKVQGSNQFKLGDGSKTWSDLDYFTGKSAYDLAVEKGYTGSLDE